jgi:hypothetical protein
VSPGGETGRWRHAASARLYTVQNESDNGLWLKSPTLFDENRS